MAERKAKKLIAQNKKARHDYFVLDTYEAGVVLYGTEVKSVRQGTVNLKDSYCTFEDGELFVLGFHISPYEKGNIFNREPLRPKKLLMHKTELMRLFGKVSQQGLTLVPLSVYLLGPYVKMEIGLCQGKKLYDKRASDAKRQADRAIERYTKGRNQQGE